MNSGKFISKLQTIFGVSKAELNAVALIALGLFMALVIRSFSESDTKRDISRDVYEILDSLAEANKTAYVGTDLRNNPIPELAKGDTIIKKESFFPKSVKKEDKISGKINLNTASKVQLMKIPGIGEKTALKIIDFRKASPFKKSTDITNIKGIGQKKYEKMKPFICVE